MATTPVIRGFTGRQASTLLASLFGLKQKAEGEGYVGYVAGADDEVEVEATEVRSRNPRLSPQVGARRSCRRSRGSTGWARSADTEIARRPRLKVEQEIEAAAESEGVEIICEAEVKSWPNDQEGRPNLRHGHVVEQAAEETFGVIGKAQANAGPV